MSTDFSAIIADSVQDLETDAALEAQEAPVETPVEASESALDSPEAPADGEVAQTTEVPAEASPEAQAINPADLTAFQKEHGLPPTQPGARENRIPYSRVKAISDNAVKKATEPLTAKLTEFETKVKTYEDRLGKVAEFEKVMAEDPVQFLNMLATIPTYKQLFDQLGQGARSAAPAQQEAPSDPFDTMPMPDGPDGSYTQEGVKALMKWNAEHTEKRVIEQVTARYKPLEEQREAAEYKQKLSEEINRSIEAVSRKPLFREHQAAIEQALLNDKTGQLTLQEAYEQVVFNALQAKLNNQRQEILKEVKAAPKATAVAGSATKPAPASTNYNGVKSFADIIRDSVEASGAEI